MSEPVITFEDADGLVIINVTQEGRRFAVTYDPGQGLVMRAMHEPLPQSGNWRTLPVGEVRQQLVRLALHAYETHTQEP